MWSPSIGPLHLGDAVVAHRDYMIVEVTTSDGVVGRAIGNARNSPVHLLVRDVIAPLVIGLDPLRTEHVWARMYYGCLPIGQRGGLMSALSLVDICCWDIKAQIAGMPLATLLGGYRDDVDVAIAGGYPDLTPEPADVEGGGRRLRRRGLPSDQGRRPRHHRPTPLGCKPPAMPAATTRELMVDLHWSWRDLQSAIRTATHGSTCASRGSRIRFPPDSPDC